MIIQEKKAKTFECKLYIGSKEGYEGREFTEEELRNIIQQFQKSQEIIAVRITKTSFVAGDYYESGWEVAAIQYPRFLRSEDFIFNFMLSLAKHLLVNFKQNRITVIGPDETVMVEIE